MKQALPKVLFYYSAFIALLITLSSGTFVFLFLPVLTYFLLEVSRRLFFPKSGILPGKIEKLLIYYGFVVGTLMVVMGFASARSPLQILTAVLFSPLLMYFAVMVVPKKKTAIKLPALKEVVIEKEEPKEVTKL